MRTKKKIEKICEEHYKCIKILRSCNTIEQLSCAQKCYNLFLEKVKRVGLKEYIKDFLILYRSEIEYMYKKFNLM